MNIFSKFKCFFVLTLILFLINQIIASDNKIIELVESIPVETTLDMKEIRNTPQVWQEMIASAKKSLEIEAFYFSDKQNEPLENILTEIKRAASRGVNVRIISEAKFHDIYPEPLNSLNEIENIEVRFIDFKKIAGGVMHAKYFIVDEVQIFLGSQNFDWRALKHIHELGIKLNNSAVARLFLDIFNCDWQVAENNNVPDDLFSTKNYIVPIYLKLVDRVIRITPVFSPINFVPDERLWDEPYIVSLIDNAKHEINIQLLSYSPVDYHKNYYEMLDNALRRAAVRKVKVKIICADWSKRKPRIDFLKSLTTIPNIEIKLSTIPEYSEGFIPYARVEHSKYMVVDGEKFWIGTSNWSKDYFYNGRNVGLIVDDKKLSEAVQMFFYNSWNSSYTYLIDINKEYIPPKVSGN